MPLHIYLPGIAICLMLERVAQVHFVVLIVQWLFISESEDDPPFCYCDGEASPGFSIVVEKLNEQLRSMGQQQQKGTSLLQVADIITKLVKEVRKFILFSFGMWGFLPTAATVGTHEAHKAHTHTTTKAHNRARARAHKNHTKHTKRTKRTEHT